MLASNIFAYLLHFADILGSPQIGRFYEPFHILYWWFKIRVPGNEYKISFIAFLACFCLLAFVGFRIYTKLRLNILGIYGSARWAKTHELARAKAFIGKGVILGQTNSAFFTRNQARMTYPGRIIFENDDSHDLVVAPTGRGKGVSCVIPTLLCWTDSVVCYDLKKENFVATSGWRKQFSHVLCFEPMSENSARFNPLMEISRGPREVADAQMIARVITHPRGDNDNFSGEHHWIENAYQLITGTILYVLNEPTEISKSLHAVASLLQSPDMTIRDVLDLMLQSKSAAVQETARNMMNKADNELSGVVSTACTFLSLYQDPYVAYNTSLSDFSVNQLVSSEYPCCLYICMDPESSDRLKPLTRLVLELIMRKLVSYRSEKRHRLLFLIDEFPSLGRLAFFEEALSFCRQYKVKCMLVSQSFNQLFKEYGERTSILDNCHHKAVLAISSPQDAKTVGDFLGTYSVNRHSVSQSGMLGSIIARSRSNSFTEVERKLMTQDELIGMADDEFILITDGKHPYKGKKIRYYLDERFTKRAHMESFLTREAQVKQLPVKKAQPETWMKDQDLALLEKLLELPPKEAIKKVKQLTVDARNKTQKQISSDSDNKKPAPAMVKPPSPARVVSKTELSAEAKYEGEDDHEPDEIDPDRMSW
jgi:type IV secretion system protein VirD4